jgi:hypothetical protein
MVPKGCSNCGVPLDIEAESRVEKFKTETECRLGRYRYVQHYYVKADRGGDLVVVPPVPTCHENAPDDLHLKEK